MDIIMPKMGESVSEGTIIKWHKKKGDQVKRDEIIFEISTDKVDTEIPSPVDGVVSDIKAQEGDTVGVGTVVAIIDENGKTSSTKEDDSENKKEGKKVESLKEESKTDSVKKEKKEEQKESLKEEKNIGKKVEVSTGSTVEVSMPKMGESVMEGTIIKWYKKVGEPVKKDETLFEISTDKVDTEVPSPSNGILAEVLVGEQETVNVGTIVAKLSTGDQKQISKSQEVKKEEPKQQTEKVKEQKEEKKETSAAMHDNFSSAKAREEEDGTEVKEKKEDLGFLSPLVMNIARKENVSFNELSEIKGTGLSGRISKKDILNYIEKRGAKKAAPTKEKPREEKAEAKTESPAYTSSQMQQSYSSDEVEKIPMDNIRQKIMQHMINSHDTSVHVSAMLEVDMTKIHNFMHAKREEYQKKENIKLTYMAFIANAVVKGLKEFPLINSSIDGSTVIQKKFINLGIAVAIEPTGLIVPNIKAADERNIIGLAKAINDLAHRARNRKLSPDDISNGTFTITNYGVFGTIFGTPIINQPEVAILGVGTVTKKPVVIEVDGSDTIAIKPIMALTLSHDHRLVDGMLGGRFLKFIKETLENFEGSSL
ncbi:MAG: 2-oxoglutarate dehydrogenase, E2 component, dihydrolipoamide succinyltransferase [Ignavibacteriaceae bacterium]